MRLLILTSAPLSACSGPQSRLINELKFLMKLNQITIVCLGKEEDDKDTQSDFSDVNFLHCPIIYNGWVVVNTCEVVDYIESLCDSINFDLVILNMEIWDLMRDLGKKLKNRVPFATIIHALPFLASPINPTDNFKSDVIKYANSGIEDYRKFYILKNFNEAEEVFKNMAVLANNHTVEFYFSKYFKNLHIWTQSRSLATKINHPVYNHEPFYDFTYMARIEKGKGLEYLFEIVNRTSKLINRKVKLVIMGRVDDTVSKETLADLLEKSSNILNIEVTFLGWADYKMKYDIFFKTAVFLYPSIYDNYPTVLNEAIAHGLPCVVWDLPYTRINYSNSKSVIRVPVFNFDEFANSLVNVLSCRETLFYETLKYINEFDSLEKTAELDTKLFNNISKSLKYAIVK